jgi:hypothetical protein
MKLIVRAGLITAALALAGCGGGSSSADRFIGSWIYTTGTLLVTYPGSDPASSTVTGSVTITHGSAADLNYSAAANGGVCNLPFDVRGAVASIRPGSSCTLQLTDPFDGTPYNLTLNPSSWTLQLSGNALAEDGQGSCTEVEPAGSVPCNFAQSADLVRATR